jgi:hypothetical protein
MTAMEVLDWQQTLKRNDFDFDRFGENLTFLDTNAFGPQKIYHFRICPPGD